MPESKHRALPLDYDHDPDRFRAGQESVACYGLAGDAHETRSDSIRIQAGVIARSRPFPGRLFRAYDEQAGDRGIEIIKLHLDTDIGGDIDDLCALAMVLGWTDVELIGVTTVAEDLGRRAGYARYALDLAGREDIPVASGAETSLGCYRWTQDFPDEEAYWSEPVPPAQTALEEALSLLERSIEQGATIVAIGPYTNLALLEERHPGILREARLFLMGGYVFPPAEGFPLWGGEMDYNVQVDVRSALCVLQNSEPTLVPLSVTVETALRRACLPALERSEPLARLVARQARAFARDESMEARFGRVCEGLPDDTINFQHDPLTCAIASGWSEGVEIHTVPLESKIEGGWLSQRIEEGGRLAKVVTRVDGRAFDEFWLATTLSSTM